MKRAIIVIILVATVVGGILFYLENSNYLRYGDLLRYRRYLKYYDYDLALKSRKLIKEQKGLLKVEGELEERRLLYFDGMIMIFDENKENLGKVQINSKNYKFGYKRVCVGMKRKDIERIFKYSKKTKPPRETTNFFNEEGQGVLMNVDTYFDNDYEIGLGFSYDKNDRVNMISVFFGL